MVNWIVIDPMRSAKGCAAIGAAGEHHVSAVASAEWYHTGHHINVVVCGRPGTVHRHERLPTKSYSIYATLNEIPTQVDLSGLVENRGDVPVLGIGRTDAIKRAPSSGKKKVAVGVHVERSRIGIVRNIDRTSSKWFHHPWSELNSPVSQAKKPVQN